MHVCIHVPICIHHMPLCLSVDVCMYVSSAMVHCVFTMCNKRSFSLCLCTCMHLLLESYCTPQCILRALISAKLYEQPGHEAVHIRLSNVEVRNGGQVSRLGKYAVHWHMIGNLRESFQRNMSIHHSWNRATALHGVNYLRVEHNFAYNIFGHAFFIEDGVEMYNTVWVFAFICSLRMELRCTTAAYSCLLHFKPKCAISDDFRCTTSLSKFLQSDILLNLILCIGWNKMFFI